MIAHKYNRFVLAPRNSAEDAVHAEEMEALVISLVRTSIRSLSEAMTERANLWISEGLFSKEDNLIKIFA